MTGFNRDALQAFGKEHADMHPETPNRYFDIRIGRLNTFLDMQIVRKWALPVIPVASYDRLHVLDVGAGKGRMTTELAKISRHCVAIEPFPDFFDALSEACTSEKIETFSGTLAEYSTVSDRTFDLIYIGGVAPYLSDTELDEFLRTIVALMNPGAVVINRELASHKILPRNQCEYVIARTPAEFSAAATSAGLRMVRQRRAYPINIPWLIYKRWPNKINEILWRIGSHKYTYPLWHLLSAANIGFNTNCFMVYMLVKDE